MENQIPNPYDEFIKKEQSRTMQAVLKGLAHSNNHETSMVAKRLLGLPPDKSAPFVPKPTRTGLRLFELGDGASITTPLYKEYKQGRREMKKQVDDEVIERTVQEYKKSRNQRAKGDEDWRLRRTAQADAVLAAASDRLHKMDNAQYMDQLPIALQTDGTTMGPTVKNPLNAKQRVEKMQQAVRDDGVPLYNASRNRFVIKRDDDAKKTEYYIATNPEHGPGAIIHENGHRIDHQNAGSLDYEMPMPKTALDYLHLPDYIRLEHPLLTRIKKHMKSYETGDLLRKHMGQGWSPTVALDKLEQLQEGTNGYAYPTLPNGEVHPDSLHWQGWWDQLNYMRGKPIAKWRNSYVVQNEEAANFNGLKYMREKFPNMVTPQDEIATKAGLPTYLSDMASYFTKGETKQTVDALKKDRGTRTDFTPSSVYTPMEDVSRTRMQYYNQLQDRRHPHMNDHSWNPLGDPLKNMRRNMPGIQRMGDPVRRDPGSPAIRASRLV